MGYSTNYSLTYWNKHGRKDRDSCLHAYRGFTFCPDCGKRVERVKVEDDIEKYLLDHLTMKLAPIGKPLKWYEYEEDMREISWAFPGWLFEIEGHGQELKDIWKTYFLDGKAQHAQGRIIFDEFDESKLE